MFSVTRVNYQGSMLVGTVEARHEPVCRWILLREALIMTRAVLPFMQPFTKLVQEIVHTCTCTQTYSPSCSSTVGFARDFCKISLGRVSSRGSVKLVNQQERPDAPQEVYDIRGESRRLIPRYARLQIFDVNHTQLHVGLVDAAGDSVSTAIIRCAGQD